MGKVIYEKRDRIGYVTLNRPEAQSAPAAHDRPSAHFVVHEPPQSMSVSVPFFAPSVQLGAVQRPAWQ